MKLPFFHFTGGLLFTCLTVSGQTENPAQQSRYFLHSGTDSTGLKADYFNNKTLSGSPVSSRIEQQVLNQWRKSPGIPGLRTDNFSIRWTGVIRPEADGDYWLTAAGDDGFRLFIDGNLLLDGWKDQGLTELKAKLTLKKGQEYSIRLEYYQAGGGAALFFAWYPAEFAGFTFIRKSSWANTEYYQQDNAALSGPAPGENRVVFMGDSITEGWEYQRSDFFTGTGFLNRGISGQTTSQMLVRFRQDVLNLNPAVVVILAGTNDLAGNNGPVSPDLVLQNLMSMAELAKANGIRVILCSILPASVYPWKPELHPSEDIVNLNNRIRAYADASGFVFADYFPALTDGKNGLLPALGTDAVHPNAEGYARMEPIVRDAIRKATGR